MFKLHNLIVVLPLFPQANKRTLSSLFFLGGGGRVKKINYRFGVMASRVCRDAQNVCAITIVGTVLKVPYRVCKTSVSFYKR